MLSKNKFLNRYKFFMFAFFSFSIFSNAIEGGVRLRFGIELTAEACQREFYTDLMKLEIETWPDGTRAQESVFRIRLSQFPAGFILAYDTKFRLVGFASSMIIAINSLAEVKSWGKTTNRGRITNHQGEGNALYVVSVGVRPDYQRQGVGTKLVKAQIALAKNHKLEQVIVGSRVPNFHLFDGTIEEYLSLQDDEGFSVDPEIKFYQKCGFRIHGFRKNYMTKDLQSKNFGVLMIKDL